MTPDQVIDVLAWAATGLLMAVVALACWIVVRTFDAQNARNHADEGRWSSLNDRLTTEFHAFGQGLASLRDLLTLDIHKHDVRITKLEEWRKAKEQKEE